ncbi:MAG: DevR family CRISPR-associated autoregulator [Desulfurococcaceae archaeon]
MVRGPYIRIAGQLEVQVSALTGAGSIGNYNMHAVARIVHKDRVYEVPIMTGNAMKHWHAYYTAQVYQSLGGQKLNEFCKKGIGLRGYTADSSLTSPREAGSESQAIEDLCNDLHGFLLPRGGRAAGEEEEEEERKSVKKRKRGEEAREVPVKRDSLIKFSFIIPVLDERNLEIVSKFAVTHNRVDPRPIEETQMMVFKQEYATASYGFNSSLDLAYVCKPIYEEVSAESMSLQKGSQKRFPQQEVSTMYCDVNEVARRVRSAILAFINLLLAPGAKQARALPIIKVKELFAVVANKPIPSVISGAYSDYMEKSLRILADYYKALSASGSKDDALELKIYCYSESAEKCSNLHDEWQNIIKTSEKTGEFSKMYQQKSAEGECRGETFKVCTSFSSLIKELADDSVKYVDSK